MYDFLMSHAERIILIAGNHEDLLMDMCDRGFWESHDLSNGTAKTVAHLSGREYERGVFGINLNRQEFTNACLVVQDKMEPLYKRMCNYFETKNYIFVHAFIPTLLEKDDPEETSIWARTHDVYYDEWREAHDWQWEQARWVNPFKMFSDGLNQTGKTIVFGHWHTSWQYMLDKYKELEETMEEWPDQEDLEWGDYANYDIYYGDNFIGLDACTAHSGKVNILVLEDDLLDE